MGEDAALSSDDAVGLHARSKMLSGGERCREGLEVAVVDPDELSLEVQRSLELSFVMHLGKHIHAEVMCAARQIFRRLVINGGHDDQDAVSAPGPRLQ